MGHGRRAAVAALTLLLLGSSTVPALAGTVAPGTAPVVAAPTDPETTDAETTDPDVTDPDVTDPDVTDPDVADPGATDPGATDPGATDPDGAGTDPAATGTPSPYACLTTTAADGYAPPGRCELVIARAAAVCRSDVPYLQYAVEPYGTPNTTVTITWVNPAGQSVVQSGLPLSGTVLWPGAVVENGVAVDWPGWSRAADGTWVEHDEFDFTRPDVQVLFQVNPEATTVVHYPEATAACGAPPTTTVVPPTTGVTTTSQVLAAPDPAEVVAGVTYRSAVLAVTGANSWQLLLAGLVTVGAGVALVLASGRRGHRTR